MADAVIARSLSFCSCFHPFFLSPKPILLPSLPTASKRTSSSKILSSQKSSSSSSSSFHDAVSGDYGIVSTSEHSDGSVSEGFGIVSISEHSDGSVLFRFGEISKNVQMGKEEIVVDDCVDEFELGGEGSDTDHTNGMSEELLEDSILDGESSDGNNVNVLEMINFKILTPPANQSELDGVVEVETIGRNSNVTSSAIDSELDIVFSEEEVSQEDSISEGEIVSELVESDVEVPNNVALQAETKENNEVQVMHLSSGRQEHSMQQHTEANKMTVHEGSSRDIVEVLPDSASFEAKIILDDEPTCDAVDEEPTHMAVNEEPTHIAVDEEPTPKAVNEEPTHIAVDEELTHKAVDEETTRNAVDDEPIRNAVDEEPAQLVVDEEPTHKAVDGKPTSNVADEEPTSIQMHKESTHNTVDEESTHIAIDEEPTPKAVDEERTRVAVDEETINVEVVESSKMLEGNLPSSNWVEEIAGGDYSSNNADMAVPHVEESQMRVATLPMEEISMSGFFMFCGAASLPHPSKALTGGEDAYFVDKNWLGIADGVGQWSLEGTNAGLYAQELINNCGKIVVDSKSTLITNPVQVLDKAAMETKSLGSSTALVAYFDGQAI
ncbi:probable protein phosphatase 2C 62 isoform X2 [Hevea brasiliensis]|uniref:probable protein phosphatase 2C 62 isoform X2 n=1 Tax=Hevea brasiliensis TaxID=3981 RepID=UPI0025E00060|nr:probable protein phosphatase 2C 62 isoform X2 [Hevea brasiliensis]